MIRSCRSFISLTRIDSAIRMWMWGEDLAGLKEFINFLNKLEESSIFYKLNKVRNESIMVEVAVPGQRWEIEFMEDGTVDIEKFISDGNYYDVKELESLFKDFSD